MRQDRLRSLASAAGAALLIGAALPLRTGAGPAADTVQQAPEASSLGQRPDWNAALDGQRAAVVDISVIKLLQIGSKDADDAEDEAALADLLREEGRPPPASGLPARMPLRDQGCGLIVSRDGYVLTAAHLVHNARWVGVRLTQGREYTATVVGLDPPSDVAVLKIDAADLPVVRLGAAVHLRPGDPVAAIGAPFGLRGSVTAGTVSATNRVLEGDDSYLPFIQTDMSLNPGSSGGPLFDAHGYVVGINSEIVFRGSGNAGIGFAIPIEVALGVETQLIRHGRIERGSLGIGFQDLDAQLARAFGLPAPAGALVHTAPAAPGAAPERAALRVGDIILELDGHRISCAGELAAAIAALVPGSSARLGIWRDRGLIRASVQVDAAATSAPGAAPEAAEGRALPDLLAVRELSAKERSVLGTDGYLMVTAVSVPAAAAGVQAGDIVLGADGTPLHTPAALHAALTRGPGPLPLLIEHDGLRTFVALPLDGPAIAGRPRPPMARGG